MFGRPVSEIMTSSVCSIHMNERIDKAIHLFLENCISILPVVNTTGCCVGVVTLKDVVVKEKSHIEGKETPTREIADILVSDAMSSEFKWIEQQESIAAAAKKTVDNSIHHLVVLDENKCLVGVVSSGDILKKISESNKDTLFPISETERMHVQK
jgi:predicted transcriptional regulator